MHTLCGVSSGRVPACRYCYAGVLGTKKRSSNCNDHAVCNLYEFSEAGCSSPSKWDFFIAIQAHRVVRRRDLPDFVLSTFKIYRRNILMNALFNPPSSRMGHTNRNLIEVVLKRLQYDPLEICRNIHIKPTEICKNPCFKSVTDTICVMARAIGYKYDNLSLCIISTKEIIGPEAVWEELQ